MRRHSNASSTGSKSRTAPIAALLAVAAALLGLAAPSASAAVRAFELVSPVKKNGNDIVSASSLQFFQGLPRISEDGDTVVYVSRSSLPGAGPVSNGAANFFRAERTASGWDAGQLSSIIGPFNAITSLQYGLFSRDLGKAVQEGPFTPGATPDAEVPAFNLYLWESSGFTLLTPGMPSIDTNASASADAASNDFGHIIFTVSEGALNAESTPGVFPVVYDWNAATGTPKVVGIMPNDDPSPDPVTIAAPFGGSGSRSQNRNSVSANGSRIFFYSGQLGAPTQLFVRIDGTETKHVSESQRAQPDPDGTRSAEFRIASEDGKVAYFTSREKLTDDSTAGVGEDLYRYEVETETLTDITVEPVDLDGAQVQGVLGAADDGSRVYFVAKGVLDAGATVGQNNLYVWTVDGGVDFVATGVGQENWTPLPTFGDSVVGRVTPDGEQALFSSSANLGGAPTNGFNQAFLYDATTDELTCASCDPDGPATADAQIFGTGDNSHFARTLTDDGQAVFFTTTAQLLGADTNGVQDVYEFDAALDQLNLITTGEGEQDMRFADATPDGSDVVFVTRQRLVGVDRDFNFDAYDARIGGGIASQNPPPPPPPCIGEDCRGPIVAGPPAPVPGSNTHSGPGNQKPKHKKPKKKGKKNKKKQRNGNGNRNGRR